MTRERRAIDTTTASIFSLSLSRSDLRRRDETDARSPADSHLSRRRAAFGELAEMHGNTKAAGRRRKEGRDTFHVARNLRISRESRTDFASRLGIHGRLFPPPCYLFGSPGEVSYGCPRASMEQSSFRRLLAAKTCSEGVRVTRDKLQEGKD